MPYESYRAGATKPITIPIATPKILEIAITSREHREKSEYDKTDSSVSIRSMSTIQSQISRGTMVRHQEDLVDENNNNNSDDQNELAVSPSSWVCYGLILTGLLYVSVSFAGFIIVDWNDYRTNKYVIVGVALVFVALIAFVVYGIDLKSRRNHQRKGTMWPAVVIGVCLIVAGILVPTSIIGNCDNIPPLQGGGPRCNLHVWSGLALASSIALCFMGGFLACCLPLCCDCGTVCCPKDRMDIL